METNWITIGAVVILAIGLLIFLIKRNLKDKKDLETFLENNDMPIDKENDEPNNKI
jgi:uncharacterized membrane-anchored protein YhcB (DUF1043 family)